MSNETTQKRELIECTRCKGSGFLKGMIHVDQGRCFSCMGSGRKPTKRQRVLDTIAAMERTLVYTVEEAKLIKAGKSWRGDRWKESDIEHLRGIYRAAKNAIPALIELSKSEKIMIKDLHKIAPGA